VVHPQGIPREAQTSAKTPENGGDNVPQRTVKRNSGMKHPVKPDSIVPNPAETEPKFGDIGKNPP